MSELSSPAQSLLKSFRDNLDKWTPGGDGALANLAVGALEDVIQIAADYAREAVIQTTFFADHGQEHHARLALRATELLDSAGGKFPAESPLRDVKALLLLYAAFVMHDIGMGVRIADADVGTRSIRMSQIQRKAHDQRSLELIERTLIQAQEASGSTGLRANKWAAFWEQAQTEGWPESPAKWAAYLLARICLTHADQPDLWLRASSIDTYAPRLQPHSSDIDFRGIWESACWENTIAPCALAAATVLCLCDLCDIGAGRFPTPPDEWIADELPDSADKIRVSFLHWAAHQLSTLSFEGDHIVLTIARAGTPNAVLALPVVAGPVPALIKWGSSPVMQRNLRMYVNTGYAGITLRPGPAKDDTWAEVQRMASLPKLASAWEIPGVADIPDHNFFTRKVLLPHWWHECVDCGDPERWSAETGRRGAIATAISARDRGAPYEDIIDLASTAAQARVMIVRPSDPSAGQAATFCDGLFAAVRLARDILLHDPTSYSRVLVLMKGDALYNIFVDSGEALDEYRGCILICPMTSKADLWHYTRIAEAASHAPNRMRVILFGDQECVDYFSGDQLTTIGYSLNQDLLAEFVAARVSEPGQPTTLPDGTRVPIGLTPHSIFEAIILAAPATKFLEEAVRLGLNELDHEGEARGFGVYLLLLALEYLDWGGSGRIDEALVHRQFTAMSETLPRLKICGASEAIALLSGRGDIALVGSDIILSDHYSDVKQSREVVAERSRKLMLLGRLFLLTIQKNGVLHSLHASLPLYDAVPQQILLKAATTTANLAEPFHARANLGLWLGDRLGTELVQNFKTTAEIVEVILASYPSEATVALGNSMEMILRQQMAYRLGVRAITRIDELAAHAATLPKAAVLGLLEAAASIEHLDPQAIRSVRSGVRDLISNLCEETEATETLALNAAIGYDILFKYEAANEVLRTSGRKLWRLGEAQGWRPVAEFFHHGVGMAERPEQRGALFEAWQEFRKALFEFVANHTPPELGRRGPDPAALERTQLAPGEVAHAQA